MDNNNKKELVLNKVNEISTLLNKDEQDGYILRPDVRKRWEDHMNWLIKEYEDLIENK